MTPWTVLGWMLVGVFGVVIFVFMVASVRAMRKGPMCDYVDPAGLRCTASATQGERCALHENKRSWAAGLN